MTEQDLEQRVSLLRRGLTQIIYYFSLPLKGVNLIPPFDFLYEIILGTTLRLDPEHKKICTALSIFHHNQLNSSDYNTWNSIADSIAFYKESLKINPDNVSALVLMTSIYYKKMKQNEVERNLAKLEEIAKKGIAYHPVESLYIAIFYEKRERFNDAKRWYERNDSRLVFGTQGTPPNLYSMAGLAMMYEELGKTDKAEALWKKIKNKTPLPCCHPPERYRRVVKDIKDQF